MIPISEEKILCAIRAELDHMKIEGGFDVRPETRWADLDVDSLEMAELVNALEDRFHVRIADGALENGVSVGDAIALVQFLSEPAMAA